MIPENAVAKEILKAALRIHKRVGPGLLESVYKNLLAKDLEAGGHKVQTEVIVPVTIDGIYFEQAFRADMIVDDLVIVEVKTVAKLVAEFSRQLSTYLQFTKKRLGLLINFSGDRLFDGVKRVANGMPEEAEIDPLI